MITLCASSLLSDADAFKRKVFINGPCVMVPEPVGLLRPCRWRMDGNYREMNFCCRHGRSFCLLMTLIVKITGVKNLFGGSICLENANRKDKFGKNNTDGMVHFGQSTVPEEVFHQ